MTDYNEQGIEYVTYAQNVHAIIGGYLSKDVIRDFVRIKSQLTQLVSQVGEVTEAVKGAYGVLSQIDGFLLQAERLHETLAELRRSALSPVLNPEIPRAIIKRNGHQEPIIQPPALIWLSSRKIEIDFDSLLSRATSTLERFAKYVCVAFNIPPVRNFFNLKDHILENQEDEQRVESIVSLIDEVLPDLTGTLVSDGRGRSMRNTLTHHSSVPELTDRGITINWLADGKVLAFDLEIEGYPLVGSAHRIIGTFSYFMFNGLRILLTLDKHLKNIPEWNWLKFRSKNIFKPTWPNPLIHFESFIDPSHSGPRVSVVKPQIGGIRAHTQHLREEVFNFAATPVYEENHDQK